ncbi:Tn3 family transposase [Spirosoma flavum]|uniref:Tn3 family transposase n=1 Tax=Spirosoma flavum TaxID=2048557 RepID=A0ABW6AJM7_9BACT
MTNAITCWNVLRITQQLNEVIGQEREDLLAAIPHTAPLSWKHINFQGEYDFSEGGLRCPNVSLFCRSAFVETVE